MMVDDIVIHHLMCDYLNLNSDTSSTDILEVSQNTTSVDLIVECGEVGKTPKKFEISINFSELN